MKKLISALILIMSSHSFATPECSIGFVNGELRVILENQVIDFERNTAGLVESIQYMNKLVEAEVCTKPSTMPVCKISKTMNPINESHVYTVTYEPTDFKINFALENFDLAGQQLSLLVHILRACVLSDPDIQCRISPNFTTRQFHFYYGDQHFETTNTLEEASKAKKAFRYYDLCK